MARFDSDWMGAMATEPLYVVELQPMCWLAIWPGDPGRTLRLSDAKHYATEHGARTALGMARRYRTFRSAEVYALHRPAKRPIRAGHRFAQVYGERFGPLMLHPAYGPDDGWSVTHQASGLRVALVHGPHSAAVEVVAALQGCPVPWDSIPTGVKAAQTIATDWLDERDNALHALARERGWEMRGLVVAVDGGA